MLKKTLLILALSTLATTAFASDYARREAKQVIDLKDGTTVYVFNNGKMAMESKYGRAQRMAPGTVMEGKDGQQVAMVGDEVARLETLLRQDYRSNR